MPGSKLISLTLGIFFLFVFGAIIFSILFPGTVKSLLALEKFLPTGEDEGKIIGKISAGDLELLQNNLAADITNNIDKSQCLIPLSDTSILNDFEDYGIELANYQGKVKVRVFKSIKGKEGYIRLEPKTTEQEIQICIINPEAFYDCYLKDKNRDCTEPLYKDIEKASLEKENIIIDENNYNYFQNYLIKPRPNLACFVPVDGGVGGCDASNKGIDDDCLGDIRYNIPLCGRPIDNLQLCQIMYQCVRTENVEIADPKQRCNQDNPSIWILNREEDCDKVKECSNQIASQYDVISQSKCTKIQNAIWTLSFPSIS